MTVDFTGDFDINITLSPAPFPEPGFSNVLLISPKANSSLPASTVVKAYKQGDGDTVTSDWTSEEKKAFDTYFAQEPTPDTFYIGEWDKVGGDTTAVALQSILDVEDDFYGVALNSRTDTEQETLSGEIESQETPLIHILQSSLADIVTTSTDPALNGTDLADVIGRERSMIMYHPTDAEFYDVGQGGAVLPFDPDRTSAPHYNEVKEVASVAGNLPSGANIGTAQSNGNLRDNNANTGLPLPPADFFTKPGTNAAGRQMSVILTRDWFESRLQGDVQEEVVLEARRGNKIPVGEAGRTETIGQVRMAKIIERRYQQGVQAGHFLEDNLNIRYPKVTQANVDNGVIPLEADITVAIGAQAVTFNLFFQRTPV